MPGPILTNPGAPSPAISIPNVGAGLGLGQWVPPPERPVGLTVRYVRKTGSDSNGGTSPSDAWLTINKALTTVAAGTIIYVGAGTYREVVSVTNSGTPSAPIYLQGDVDGGFTGDQGPVILTAYLTNDTTAPSAIQLITAASKNDLVFQNILFVNGTGGIDSVATGLRRVFRDCGFFTSRNAAVILGTVATGGVPLNRLYDRCVFVGMTGDAAALQSLVSINLGVGVSGDIDHNLIFANSFFWNSSTFAFTLTGQASAPRGGGLRILNCTTIGALYTQTGSTTSAVYKTLILGNLIFQGGNGAVPSSSVIQTNGNAAGTYEDYNYVIGNGGIVAANVTSGGHTVQNTGAPMFSLFGIERIWGGMLRPFGEPFSPSPADAHGTFFTPGFAGVAAPAALGKLDLRGIVRPMAPLGWNPGYLQRGMNLAKETGTVFSGTSAISVTGAGYQDFQLPLDVGTATLTIYCRYDSSYRGPLPQFQVMPNENMAVGTASVDAPSGQAGVWNQLTIVLTPTAKGICTVRVVSNDTSGAGKAIFDAFNVT